MAVPSANGRKLHGGEDEGMSIVNGRKEEDMQFDPSAPPPFRVAEIRAAIPKHCWVKNPWRSLAYVLRDIMVILSLVVMAVSLKNITRTFWPIYWAAQGTMFWAIFVLGHDWYNFIPFFSNHLVICMLKIYVNLNNYFHDFCFVILGRIHLIPPKNLTWSLD